MKRIKKQLGAWRIWKKRISVTLACIVVFVTVYAMVLPAITLDQDAAEQEEGLVLETENTESEPDHKETDMEESDFFEEEDSSLWEDNTEETVEDTWAMTDGPVTLQWPAEPEEAVEAEEDVFYDESGDEIDYSVEATFGEESGLPADVTLQVTEIKAGTEEYEAYHRSALEAVKGEGGDETEISYARFFDITFLTADGIIIEPTGPVNIVIRYKDEKELKAEAAEDLNVVHFAQEDQENQNSLEDLPQPEIMDIETEIKDDQVESITFGSESFSVYGVVGTYTVEVDAEEGEGGEHISFSHSSSLKGGDSILLSDLLEEAWPDREDLRIMNVAEVTAGEEASEEASADEAADGNILKVSFDEAAEDYEITADTEQGEDLSGQKGSLTVHFDDGNTAVFRITISGTPEVDAGDGLAVISSADGSYLPETVEGSAEELAEEDISDSAAETVAAGGSDTVSRIFDISLNLSQEEQEAYNEGFLVNLTLPEEVTGRDFHLYHIHDGQTEELAIEKTGSDPDSTGLETVSGIQFVTESFSEFVLQYTVDFHWEVNGKQFDFSIPGGGFVSFYDLVKVLGIAADDADTDKDEIRELVDSVENITFSNPALVSVSKVNEDTTAGAIKDRLGLECVYSEELTEEQIAEINAQEVKAGDWALISLKAFDTEESMTVTMKNGEQFTLKVTDAAIAKENLVTDAGYIIYTQEGNKYYVLKTDGSTEEFNSTVEMDHLGNEYKWKFTYVYVEDGIERYNIRPYSDKSISLSLNYPGQALVENGPNNITIVPADDANINAGYIFGGFHNTQLKLNNAHAFEGAVNESTPVFIYQLEDLHYYEFTVVTNNNNIGKVSGTDKNGNPQTEVAIFTAVTKNYEDVTAEKVNKNEITAVADTSIQGANNTGSRYIFDHWELNGQPLYKKAGKITTEVTYTPESQNTENPVPAYWGEVIGEEELIIPYNGSMLRSVFTESSTYEAQDDDKQGTEFESMDAWLSSLIESNSPIKESATKKTAEVYDYENRVYRVDLTTQSNLRTINGNLDLGFVLDVSGSMKFPSKLDEDTTQGVRDIWQINNAYSSHWDHGYYDQWGNWVHNDYYGDWTEFVDEYYWQHWGLIPGNYYYVIAESDTRSTVFRLFYSYSDGAWKRVDASYDDNSDTAKVIRSSENNNNNGTSFGVDNRSNTSGYQIYVDGDYPNQRRDYEQSSISNTIGSLKKLITALTLVRETQQSTDGKNPDSRIAWNTFCANIPKWHPNFTSVTSNETIITNSDYAYAGGTRTDLALGTKDEGIKNSNGQYTTQVHEYGAYNFDWDTDNESNYVILITDGAPQYGQGQRGPSTASGKQQLKENTDNLVAAVKENIEDLREDKNVKVVTVGLSMDDVEQGRKMLYDIADTVNGERMFYSAESGDQLEDILLHIIDTIMVDATVVGNVTDTIGEAFYPVDLATGTPLGDGDYIDLYGNKVDESYTDFKGRITKEGNTYKVEWPGQDIPKTGWHGTVYVKAKEDFLGGNAVVTNNDDLGIANVTAYAYKFPGKNTIYPLADEAYILDTNGDLVTNNNYKLSKDMDTPRVNVNELNFLQNNTEWTVYLGTEVDPLEQMKALYNNIEVEEVVQEGAAGSGKLPSELISGKTKADYSYDYVESISDKREPKTGTTQTFLMKDLIESLVDKTGYTSTDWWDYAKNDIRWDELIRMANLAEQDEIIADDPDDPEDPSGSQAQNTGLIIPYKPYGIQDGGYIRIMLTQETEGTEIDFEGNTIPAHETTQIGDSVEKYSLTVFYTPDYTTVPVGQGGDPATAKEFRTGGFGTAYQGHATGTEESINDHEINVYAKGLDVLKIDENNRPLPRAVFTLYREALPEENGQTLDAAYGLTGSYIQVADGTSGTDGIADLGEFILKKDTTYYLVETSVPAGYQRDTAHKVIVLEAAEDGIFTDLKNAALTEKTYPFNWAQGVKVLVDGETSQTVNAEIVGGYAKLTPELLFRATVLNERKTTDLEVTKNWKDKTGKATAEEGYSISFKVTRRVGEDQPQDVALTEENLVSAAGVSLSGSIVTLTYSSTDGWPTAEIVKLPYEEIIGTGTRKYIYEVVETAHTPAEKEVTISYNRTVQDDQNIDITIENTDVEQPVNISVEKKWLDAHGNPWTDPDLDEITFILYKVHYVPCEHNWVDTENCKPATCEEDGLYERRCTKCGEVESTVLLKTDHDWGEWETVKVSKWDPSLNNGEGGIAPGIKQRVCRNDASHIETKEYTIEEHECTPGEWTTTKAATCDQAGEETQYCTICLKPLATRVIPALNHNWQVSSIQAATCNAEGRVDYVCLNDPSHTRYETVPRLEHIWGEWYVFRQATVEQEGEMRRDCLRECGAYESKPIPKLPDVVNVTVYTDKQRYGNLYTRERTQNYEVKVGSTMHIEFEEFWFNRNIMIPQVRYRLNCTENWNDSQQAYELQGTDAPMDVSYNMSYWGNMSWEHPVYSIDIEITENTRIDICIPFSWVMGTPTPTITITEPAPNNAHAPGMNTNATFAPRPNKAAGLLKSAMRLRGPASTGTLTPQQLNAIMSDFITPEELAERDKKDDVWIKEIVGSYTISKDDTIPWHWDSGDLPRSDELGRPYTYYVMETVPSSGYVTAYSYDQADGLTDDETETITNQQLPGGLKIIKEVTVDNAPTTTSLADGDYIFTVTKKNDSTFEAQTVTITISGGQPVTSEEIGNLLPGTYIVTENVPTNGTAVSHIDGISTDSYSTEVEVLAGRTGNTAVTVTFTNNYRTAQILLKKIEKGSLKQIAGARFSLKKGLEYADLSLLTVVTLDNAGNPTTTPATIETIHRTNPDVDIDVIVVPENGVKISGLPNGDYLLTEEEAPDGYIITDSGTAFTVSNGAVDGDPNHTFTVENEPGAALPSTGGPGTALIYILGVMLTGLAGAGLAMRRRRTGAA